MNKFKFKDGNFLTDFIVDMIIFFFKHDYKLEKNESDKTKDESSTYRKKNNNERKLKERETVCVEIFCWGNFRSNISK